MGMNEIQDQIVDEFAALEDSIDKYKLLIRHGALMPAMDNKFRIDKYAIKGCQSKLWIASDVIDGNMTFHADSDSKIVRGMAAVVLKVVNNQPPDKVAKVDLYFINRIGLQNHLSPVRANGLATIVKRIRELADDYLNYSVGENSPQEKN
jgi:cysteine desulfuration protein SufE